MSTTLEQRIATALSSDISSDVVEALISEVETAAAAADKAAEQAHERALDPTVIDATTRREAEDVTFTRDRLRAALPRLRERLQQVQAAEYAARWEADFEEVEGRRNEMAQEYVATYPRLVAQLVDLFERIEAVDKEASRINGSAPSCEQRRLRQVELVARGFEAFSRSDPAITKIVQLPDWENSSRMVWPPPQPALAVMVAMSMAPPHDPHYTADWAAAQKEDNARRAATEKRWAEEEAARQAESRRAYEASLRR